MDKFYSEMLQRVEQEIAQLALPQTPAQLYDPVRYIMSLGGKRVRPILTLLGCELFGTPYEKAMNQALAVELFHNFSLVHDDVMDSADVRRKLPTVHKKWSHNVALLSGDAMLVLAYQKLLQCGDSDLAKRLADTFSKAAIEVCEGQQLDMDYALRDSLTMSEYTEMIRLKTAVLLSCSLQMGAMVAGAKDTALATLKTFAESLGLAFQVKDDYLDAFGNADFGKSIGGDIAEGKRTWLTVKSFELADTKQKTRLTNAYQNPDTAQRQSEVMAVYEAVGVSALAQSEVERYSREATTALNNLAGNARAKACLLWLVEQLVGRTV